jgi:tRNA modification GTPase
MPLEFVASDIRLTLDHLGEITGRNASSEVLDKIFSRFCIGK